MRKVFIILGALLIISLAAGGALFVSSKDRILSGYQEKRGASAEKKEDYLKAAESYQKALAYDSGQIGARLGLCRVYLAQNDFESAEKTYLDGIGQVSDSTELYIGLSSAYVMQNKLYEASQLINNIQSDYVRVKIGSMRPKPPEFSPAPGRYNRRVEVEIKGSGQETCYYSLGGDLKDAKPYSGVLSLETGQTVISAVSVSEDGLVSDVTTGQYALDRIVERAYFDDPAIEAMAREALSKPSGTFMTDELWAVRSLSNVSKDGKILADTIKTLKDLSFFPGLEELKLCRIKNDIPLETMPEMASVNSLTLSDCSLTNDVFSKLASLSLLRELDLSDNKLDRLDGIGALKNLEKLNVSGNNISDLNELSSLPELSYLDAGENAILDIGPLSELKKLAWLSIADNRVNDLSPVLNLSGLSFLDISKNGISDVSQLSGFSGLKGLLCEGNEIEDLSPIAGLENLEVIDFQNNRIADIDALEPLKKLKSVNLSGNYIADLSALSENVQITQLMISRNRLKDISPIAKLAKLVLLDVQDNPIEDYSPLSDCEQLQTVFSDQQIENLNQDALVSGSVEGMPADGD